MATRKSWQVHPSQRNPISRVAGTKFAYASACRTATSNRVSRYAGLVNLIPMGPFSIASYCMFQITLH